MEYIAKTQQEAAILTSVLDGAWGTVGPRFEKAGEEIARWLQVGYGLMVFSASAALETILRSFNIGFGDEVIVAAWSDPVDAMVTAAVGAKPVFADIAADTLTLSAQAAAGCVTNKTRAIIADLPGGNPCDASGLQALCREKGLKLILNLADAWSAKQEGLPIYQYADAAFVNFSEGCAIDLGLGAAVVTDEVENHKLFYAYHNCGRPWGVVESTLSFDEILGGDLRVAEWQASLLPGRLEKAAQVDALCKKQAEAIKAALPQGAAVPVISGGEAAGRGVLAKNAEGAAVYPAMHLQPFFRDDYFEKLTGCKLTCQAGNFPVSEAAAKNVCLVK